MSRVHFPDHALRCMFLSNVFHFTLAQSTQLSQVPPGYWCCPRTSSCHICKVLLSQWIERSRSCPPCLLLQTTIKQTYHILQSSTHSWMTMAVAAVLVSGNSNLRFIRQCVVIITLTSTFAWLRVDWGRTSVAGGPSCCQSSPASKQNNISHH